jgi:hypothetical protein
MNARRRWLVSFLAASISFLGPGHDRTRLGAVVAVGGRDLHGQKRALAVDGLHALAIERVRDG